MKNIYVTQPVLPPLKEFLPYLEKIWKSKWLTNGGPFHQELEKKLADYLGVDHLALFANGTLALVTALQALRINGEVITTPFSFVATAHSLLWNGIKPVFVDIHPETFNLDPEKIEAAITPHTTAILPVHVYGHPCNVDRIQKIADTYGLKVIIDLVRRRKLREEFSWLWLLTGTVVIVLAVWYDLLKFITGVIGAVLPTTTLFLSGLIFLMIINLYYATKISILHDHIKDLAQHVAILQTEVQRLTKKQSG